MLLNKEKLAKTVSVISGPHIWGPIIILITIFNSGLTQDQIKILLPTALILIFILPIGYLTLMTKLGKISSWDMSNLKERPKTIGVMIIPVLFALVVTLLVGNTLMQRLILLLVTFGITAIVISKFWKISLHTGINTAGFFIINYLFNWSFPWLFLLLFPVFWARMVLKKHDLIQLFFGSVVSFLLCILFLN